MKVIKPVCPRQVYLQPQRAPTQATDKADDTSTADYGGNNDGGDGSATTVQRQRNDNNDKGGVDGDGSGDRGCANDHVILGGFASSRNSDRRFHTIPLTYEKGTYRPPQGKQSCRTHRDASFTHAKAYTKRRNKSKPTSGHQCWICGHFYKTNNQTEKWYHLIPCNETSNPNYPLVKYLPNQAGWKCTILSFTSTPAKGRLSPDPPGKTMPRKKKTRTCIKVY